MKKNLLSRLLCSLLAILLIQQANYAKPIDAAKAALVGKHFFQGTKKGSAMGENLSLSLVYGEQPNSPAFFYVFNVNATAGFVMVAADDAVQPILAYSNEGAFDPNNLPDALKSWLQGYEQEIGFVRQHQIKATSGITQVWNTLQTAAPAVPESGGIGPLLETQWNQGPNENMFCPGGSVTGCVATAMAQVMYYWKHPAQGIGSHSYVENDYGTLSADFGATAYQWGLMPWKPSSPDQWISKLMLHCGISVDMNYSPAGSGTNTSDVPNALKTYFKYDPNTVQYVSRASYTEAQWISLLKQELDALRPMQYRGVGSGGAHSFVCDGYDDSNKFHMNWGWGGSSDGFFTVNALNPGSIGAGGGSGGFNTAQGAVIGIQPDPNLQPDLQMLNPPYMAIDNPAYGDNVTVEVEFANTGGQPFTGEVTIGIYNEIDGSLLKIREDLAYTFFNIGGAGAVVTYSFQVTIPPGNYNAVLVYRNQGVTEWQQVGQNSFANRANFLVNGGSLLALNSFTDISPNPVIQGQSFSVTGHFDNFLAFDYNVNLSVDLHDMDGSWIQEITAKQVTIPSFLVNTNVPVQFDIPNGLNVAPGTYKLIFWDNTAGKMVNIPGTYLTVDYLTLLPVPPSPDVYEPNNTTANAYALPLNFQGNTAIIHTTGSNNHTTSDVDYYRLDFPFDNNYIYRLQGRLYDAGDNSNGITYTNDCIWRFTDNVIPWTPPYDNQMGTPGGEFFIRQGSIWFYVQSTFAGTSGNYLLDLEVTRIPAIDHPCGAATLPVNGQVQSGYTNANASASVYHEPNIPPAGDCTFLWCDSEQGPRAAHTIWFKFQAPALGNARVSTCNLANFDTQMAIYTASDCNDISTFTIVAANDDGNNCNGFTSIINAIGLTPGQTYYILIDGYENATGDLGIQITEIGSTDVEQVEATPDVLSVSPNPTTGLLRIQLKGENKMDQLTLTDLAGRALTNINMNGSDQNYDLDMSHLPNGVYLLQVRSQAKTITQKVVLQR